MFSNSCVGHVTLSFCQVLNKISGMLVVVSKSTVWTANIKHQNESLFSQISIHKNAQKLGKLLN